MMARIESRADCSMSAGLGAAVPSAAAFLPSAVPALTTISPQLPSSAATSSLLAVCGQSARAQDGPSVFFLASLAESSRRPK
jgi:hypothetical protein